MPRVCQHADRLNPQSTDNKFRQEKLRKRLLQGSLTCDECYHKLPDVWICLFDDCVAVGCGRNQKQHQLKHFQDRGGGDNLPIPEEVVDYQPDPPHALCINAKTMVVWCYACDDEILVREENEEESVDDSENDRGSSRENANGNNDGSEKDGEIIQKNRTQDKKSQDINQIDASDDDDGTYISSNGQLVITTARRHLESLSEARNRNSSSLNANSQIMQVAKPGLTGLQNLGNTCFMNSAIQIMLNCQPFVRYIQECREYYTNPAFMTMQHRLAACFQNLIAMTWSGKHNLISPSAIVREIKILKPEFRGFGQQDSQDCLRLILDRLHEELKYVVKNPMLLEDATLENGNASDSTKARHTSKSAQDAVSSSSASDSLESSSSTSAAPAATTTTASSAPIRYRSIISDIFEGLLESKIQCSQCGKEFFKLDSFFELDVPIDRPSPSKLKKTPSFGNGSGKKKATDDEPTSTTSDDHHASKVQGRAAASAAAASKSKRRRSNKSQKSSPSSTPKSSTHASSSSSGDKPVQLASGNAASNSSLVSEVSCVSSESDSGDDSLDSSKSSVHEDAAENGQAESSSSGLWAYLGSWFGVGNKNIRLEDCLQTFCAAEDLTNDDRYKCESCNQLVDCQKSLRIAKLPDVLNIQLKRFRHDALFSSKITTPVIFPLKHLDMQPFCKRRPHGNSSLAASSAAGDIARSSYEMGSHRKSNATSGDDESSNSGHSSGHAKSAGAKQEKRKRGKSKAESKQQQHHHDLADAASKEDHQLHDASTAGTNSEKDKEKEAQAHQIYVHPDESTKYDLFALINHRGGMNGGHYVAYAKNMLDDSWYEFDDGYVTPKTKAEIAKVEAYVLFYRRKVHGKRDERTNGFAKIEKELSSSSPEPCNFVSKLWFNRWATCAYPGPITNGDFICQHGNIDVFKIPNPSEVTQRLPESLYNHFVEKYGTDGYPAPRELRACKICENRELQLRIRRKKEFADIQRMDTKSIPAGSMWYLISAEWINSWHSFKAGGEPPGPITNNFVHPDGTPKKNMIKGTHYRGLNKNVWDYFYNIYGGGPVVIRPFIDLYPSVPENIDDSEEDESQPASPQ